MATTKKRELQYVIDGMVNSRFYKALSSANKSLSRTKNALSGMNSVQAQSAAVGRRAGQGAAFFGDGLARSVIGMAAAYVGTQQLVSGYRACMGEANETINVNKRLQTLMMNVKGTTLAQVKAIRAYADSMQNSGTVEDDVIAVGASQIATYQLKAKSIKALMPAMRDLAVGTYGMNVTQEQAIQSANLMGKVFTGQIGALRRVGINFSKAQEHILKTGTEAQKTATLIKVIGQNYGGIAEASAQTPEGKVLKLQNAWKGVQQTIGNELLPVQQKLVNWLSDSMPEITSIIRTIITAIKKVTPVLRQIWDVAYKIGSFIVKHWSVIGPLVYGVTAAFTAWRLVTLALTAQQLLLNLAMNANPIGLIITGIGLLIGGIIALVMNWDKVAQALKRAWNWFVKFGTEGAGRFIPIVGIVAAIARNWDKITAAVKGAWNWVKKFIDKVKQNPLVQTALRGAAVVGNAVRGKRALGGPVSAGRQYLVGERGPELFTPSRSGSIIPNLELRDSGGGLAIPKLAFAGGGGINVGGITINVSGGSAGDVQSGIQEGTDYLVRQLKKLDKDRRRRSFTD